MDEKKLDFDAFRTRLGDVRGREYWHSLEQLARTDEFEAFFQEEFPQQAVALGSGVDRRNFMKLMGASIALAGAACNRPNKEIVPYVKQPESLVFGKPLFFATAMPLSGYAPGVLPQSHDYPPPNIKANPHHPSPPPP